MNETYRFYNGLLDNEKFICSCDIDDLMGEPMIGVTIKVKDSKTAAITDFDGNFTIAAQPSDVLEISYIGYKPLSVKANKTTLSLKMEPDNTGLEEVVVIGYGVQKKRDLTGAISSVKSEDITISPMPNPVEALQGKVAGLDITRSSGQAGASSTMQLRGTRSLEASGDPLVLIDGMAGDLTTLNANDIESIYRCLWFGWCQRYHYRDYQERQRGPCQGEPQLLHRYQRLVNRAQDARCQRLLQHQEAGPDSWQYLYHR